MDYIDQLSYTRHASWDAFEGQIGQCAYAASKAALIGLNMPAARELGAYGIRVNAISPTFVDNGNNAEIIASAELNEQNRRGVVLGRAATAEEVGWGIYYLASPMASMVTGHNLLIDGGWTAQ